MLEGELTLFIGEGPGVRAPAGSFAHVPGGAVHGFRVESEAGAVPDPDDAAPRRVLPSHHPRLTTRRRASARIDRGRADQAGRQALRDRVRRTAAGLARRSPALIAARLTLDRRERRRLEERISRPLPTPARRDRNDGLAAAQHPPTQDDRPPQSCGSPRRAAVRTPRAPRTMIVQPSFQPRSAARRPRGRDDLVEAERAERRVPAPFAARVPERQHKVRIAAPGELPAEHRRREHRPAAGA